MNVDFATGWNRCNFMPLIFSQFMLSFGQNKKNKSSKASHSLPGHASIILEVFSLFVEDMVPRPHGNPPLNYKTFLGVQLILLTGMPFPLDGTVVGWEYYIGKGKLILRI